ncbi:MAG: hypothetical protein R2758_05200 [Bacteroidales bacterium]
MIILLLIITATVACHNQGIQSHVKLLPPDTSDLLMTDEVQQVFAARRKAILDTIGDSILFLRSDYGFDGGRA